MSEIAEFSAAQRSELFNLGLNHIQFEKLGIAVGFISMHLRKPAARNDVRYLLSDVLKLSNKLLRIIHSLSPPLDEIHSEVFQIIERSSWNLDEPDAGGPNLLVDQVSSSLVMLAHAAKNGLATLPSKPARNKTADFYPVKVIEGALLLGWLLIHMSDEEQDCLSLQDAIAMADSNVDELQLPHELRPSASPNCTFRRIVGICYEAAGGNPDPVRAINTFMAYKKDPQAWIDSHS